MSYRVTTYSALQANLSAANTAVMLCRATIGRMPLSGEERAKTIGRIRKQIRELEAMILELEGPGGKTSPPFVRTRRRKEPARRRASSVFDSAT